MIRFEFTIRLLSGDFEEWKNHDDKILEIVEKHNGINHLMTYDLNERHIQVSYSSIDKLIRAGMEIRYYFKELGIDQEMIDVRQEEITESVLDTLDKLKQAVAV
tara:strand:+ start:297 stop:608 length:312 start_codon:yes stop_codon:yes gene_type:complete